MNVERNYFEMSVILQYLSISTVHAMPIERMRTPPPPSYTSPGLGRHLLTIVRDNNPGWRPDLQGDGGRVPSVVILCDAGVGAGVGALYRQHVQLTLRDLRVGKLPRWGWDSNTRSAERRSAESTTHEFSP